MNSRNLLIGGHWVALGVCVVLAVLLVAFVPSSNELTLAAMTLLSSAVTYLLKNIGTVVDYLYGSSATPEEKVEQNNAQQNS